jgi:26S proteasome regulatory subunit T4
LPNINRASFVEKLHHIRRKSFPYQRGQNTAHPPSNLTHFELDYHLHQLEAATMTPEEERQTALNSYRSKLIESREWEAKLKNLRLEIKDLQKEFDRTEENIKALQSVGQIIGEVLKQLDEERCEYLLASI